MEDEGILFIVGMVVGILLSFILTMSLFTNNLISDELGNELCKKSFGKDYIFKYVGDREGAVTFFSGDRIVCKKVILKEDNEIAIVKNN